MDAAEIDRHCERELPGPQTQALFDRARELGVGFHVGYAELTPEGKRYNAAAIVGRDGSVLSRYRKVHLPGTEEPKPGQAFQQLEKRYFDYGDLGFNTLRAPADLGGAVIGTLICNDRRWPEAWRVLGLKGVELVCCGYNSAAYDPYGRDNEDQVLRTFHSTLVAQANAYMNSTFAACIAKAGVEDGAGLIGGSCIVDPNGRVVAEARTLADELILADIDLDACRHGKEKMFDFAAHRRIDQYGLIAAQVGVVAPE
jgi:predicted amidohydrolase